MDLFLSVCHTILCLCGNVVVVKALRQESSNKIQAIGDEISKKYYIYTACGCRKAEMPVVKVRLYILPGGCRVWVAGWFFYWLSTSFIAGILYISFLYYFYKFPTFRFFVNDKFQQAKTKEPDLFWHLNFSP